MLYAPIYVDFVEGRGRGLFAKEDIEAGSLIYTGETTACFRTGQEYRKFLASIPNGLACDVLVWAYIETADSENQDSKLISVDLDEGSFFNTISGLLLLLATSITIMPTMTILGNRRPMIDRGVEQILLLLI
jgi:hypothetical protein